MTLQFSCSFPKIHWTRPTEAAYNTHMVHNIDAIYDQGVFRPVQPVALPEGTAVHLRVE